MDSYEIKVIEDISIIPKVGDTIVNDDKLFIVNYSKHKLIFASENNNNSYNLGLIGTYPWTRLYKIGWRLKKKVYHVLFIERILRLLDKGFNSGLKSALINLDNKYYNILLHELQTCTINNVIYKDNLFDNHNKFIYKGIIVKFKNYDRFTNYYTITWKQRGL